MSKVSPFESDNRGLVPKGITEVSPDSMQSGGAAKRWDLSKFRKTPTKVIVLRALVCISLCVACALCGYFGFTLLRDSELKLFTSQYSSIVDKLYTSVTTSVSTKALTGTTLATVFTIQCPKAYDWPNCTISLDSYTELSQDLINVAQTSSMSFLPIVYPKQVDEYEEFIKNYYTESKFPPKAGYSKFGFGIYGLESDGVTRYHDVTGETDCSQQKILTPLVLTTGINENTTSLLRNIHQVCNRAQAMDSIIKCTLEGNQNCSFAITDLYLSPIPGDDSLQPASVIFNPIYLAGNDSALVGFTTMVFRWKTVLQDTVPSFVSGIDVLIATESAAYSFSITGGIVTVKGAGDLHHSKYNIYAKSHDLCNLGDICYKITFYPTESFYQSYVNTTPYVVCFGAVGIILFTSLIFLFYDFTVNQEVIEKQMVLDSKRIFVRFISHEIRTPMNVVCVGLKLLEDELKAIDVTARSTMKHKECLTLIEEMHNSSDTAVVVLNDLINYDKIEMKTMVIERKPLPIWDLILKTVRPLIVQAKHSDISIQLDLEINSMQFTPERREQMKQLLVMGDEFKLGQVIRNVVCNAIKFSSSGSQVIVSASWSQATNGGKLEHYDGYNSHGTVVIKVRDFGPGLSQENQRDLFKEGIQFNPNQLQAGQGSGLGLWISKGIVEQHGGKISVYSQGVGCGSTFIVQLPLIEKICPDAIITIKDIVSFPKQMSTSILDDSKSDLTSGSAIKDIKRILVVDDVPSNRKILCRLLRNEHFVCDEAENGENCIEKVKAASASGKDSYELILMDFEMPVMNGPTATKQLRELGYETMIIGVTGNVLPEDIKFFVDHGANAVLAKPISFNILEETFNNLMKQKQ